MYIFKSVIGSRTAMACAVAAFLAGCGAATVTPTIRPADNLAKPDRILVYDFSVAPSELEVKYSLDAPAPGRTGSEAQTREEIQIGKALAKSLTDSLVGELRSRGINAYRASEAAPATETTASIKGHFLRKSSRSESILMGFGVGDGQVRTRVQIFHATGLKLGLVAEADTAAQSNLKTGSGPMRDAAIAADAKQVALQVADRVADYYRRRGWIK